MEPLAPDSYGQFLAELKSRIQAAQLRASLAVNRELVMLYWQIGRDILDRQERERWGAKVIDRLATDLKRSFPDMKGFSPRNLKYMRAFAEAWPEEPIVQAVLAQITWYHNVAILEKLTTSEDRIWYGQHNKLPGPDHPIFIERNRTRLVVSVAGRVIADTRSALTLREAAYPPV